MAPLTRVRVSARTERGHRWRHNEDTFVVADLGLPVSAQPWIQPLRPPLEKQDGRRSSAMEQGPPPLALTVSSAVGVGLAVIDGMGGYHAGDVAARLAAGVFAATLTVAPPRGEEGCRDRLAVALEGASRAILEAAARAPVLRGAGAAAVLAVVSGDRLHLAGAGNCRAYLLREERLVQLTRDDSLVNDYLAAHGPGADLSQLPHGGILTRALGLTERVGVEASSFALRRGDVILLCTHGLHDAVDDAAIARTLLDLENPTEACLALSNLGTFGEGQNAGWDNLTVLVARAEGDDLLPPGPGDALESRNVP